MMFGRCSREQTANEHRWFRRSNSGGSPLVQLPRTRTPSRTTELLSAALNYGLQQFRFTEQPNYFSLHNYGTQVTLSTTDRARGPA